MSRQRVKDMPRSQQQAVMSKVNPSSGSGRSHIVKPSYNVSKRSEPLKKETKELIEEHHEETEEDSEDESE